MFTKFHPQDMRSNGRTYPNKNKHSRPEARFPNGFSWPLLPWGHGLTIQTIILYYVRHILQDICTSRNFTKIAYCTFKFKCSPHTCACLLTYTLCPNIQLVSSQKPSNTLSLFVLFILHFSVCFMIMLLCINTGTAPPTLLVLTLRQRNVYPLQNPQSLQTALPRLPAMGQFVE